MHPHAVRRWIDPDVRRGIQPERLACRRIPEQVTDQQGARLAAETVAQIAQIDGVAGVHLMVAGNEHAIPAILDGAGQTRRRDGD